MPAQGPSLFLCHFDIEKVVTSIVNLAHYTTNVSLTPLCRQNNVHNGHHFVLTLEDVLPRRRCTTSLKRSASRCCSMAWRCSRVRLSEAEEVKHHRDDNTRFKRLVADLMATEQSDRSNSMMSRACDMFRKPHPRDCSEICSSKSTMARREAQC